MKQLFTKLFFIVILLSMISAEKITAQTVYETVSSGAWDDVNIWMSWSSGVVGVGTGVSPVTTAPVGTNKVIINSGDIVTMDGANRNCLGLTIESGGQLWANETTPRRLQIGTGGTGFTYPLNDTLLNNGVLGGAGDGLYLESGANADSVTITGTGSFDIGKIRTGGGNGSAAGGALNFIIDANINLYQSSNYALSAVYNPAVTDNYTITINPGKTVTIMSPLGYFHNSQNSVTYGNYTYDIKGTLDVSANTQTASSISGNLIAPAPASSNVIVNVDGGILKLGSAFKADTSLSAPVSAGKLVLEATNGGLIDASNTTNLFIGHTPDGAGNINNLFFGLDATGRLSQTVGTTQVEYPIGLNTSITANNAYLTNAGTSNVFSIGIKNSFDDPLNDPTKVVERQWDIEQVLTGSANVTVGLSWLTADQPANFNPASPINTIHYLASEGWTETPATITGSGTVANPYISSTSGFTSFSPFGIDNMLGVVPVTFVNIDAHQNGNNVEVDWGNATESNISSYTIERSSDGINFSSVATVSPKTNNGGLNNYTWLDGSPNDGINYYKIMATENTGSIKYSSIAKVNITQGNSGIAIYPNPVIGGAIGLQFTNLPKGTYNVRLINTGGQELLSTQVQHPGGTVLQTINFNNYSPKGIYILEVTNPDGTKTSFRLLTE